jgi:hypothetical protein
MMNRREACSREVAMAAGLVPFVVASAPVVPGAWIGWVVIANGVATHLACACAWRYCDYLRLIDTAANVALCITVNLLTHWQPKSLLLTLYVALVWAANSPPPPTDLGHQKRSTILGNWLRSTLTLTKDTRRGHRKQARSVGVHIVLVQWTLCFLLVVYEYEWFQ